MATALHVSHVAKGFAGVPVLRDISFDLHAGELTVLAGENGAGKSTLMKILGGVYQPDEGSIVINNQAVSIHSVADALNLGIAFIHQELNVLDNLDVAANIFLGREPRWGGPLKQIGRAHV